MRERQKLEDGIKTVEDLEADIADSDGLMELAQEDADFHDELLSVLTQSAKRAAKAELEALLSGEADGNDTYPVSYTHLTLPTIA